MSDHPPQTPTEPSARKVDGAALKGWLSAPVTVTFPGWVFAAAGVAVLVLLLIALD
jgi:hypothetical protein